MAPDDDSRLYEACLSLLRTRDELIRSTEIGLQMAVDLTREVPGSDESPPRISRAAVAKLKESLDRELTLQDGLALRALADSGLSIRGGLQPRFERALELLQGRTEFDALEIGAANYTETSAQLIFLAKAVFSLLETGVFEGRLDADSSVFISRTSLDRRQVAVVFCRGHQRDVLRSYADEHFTPLRKGGSGDSQWVLFGRPEEDARLQAGVEEMANLLLAVSGKVSTYLDEMPPFVADAHLAFGDQKRVATFAKLVFELIPKASFLCLLQLTIQGPDRTLRIHPGAVQCNVDALGKAMAPNTDKKSNRGDILALGKDKALNIQKDLTSRRIRLEWDQQRGLVGEAIDLGQRQKIDRDAARNERVLRSQGEQSCVAIPAKIDEVARGAIYVASHEAHAFSAKEVFILECLTPLFMQTLEGSLFVDRSHVAERRYDEISGYRCPSTFVPGLDNIEHPRTLAMFDIHKYGDLINDELNLAGNGDGSEEAEKQRRRQKESEIVRIFGHEIEQLADPPLSLSVCSYLRDVLLIPLSSHEPLESIGRRMGEALHRLERGKPALIVRAAALRDKRPSASGFESVDELHNLLVELKRDLPVEELKRAAKSANHFRFRVFEMGDDGELTQVFHQDGPNGRHRPGRPVTERT